MGNSSCCSCLKPKATLQCGICDDSVCKECAQFLGEDSFSFLKEIPKNLSHSTYCYNCFDRDVAAELAAYEKDMKKAEGIMIFEKAQSKETRNFRRHERPYQIPECADREEALLRLAFMAVRDGFNALIDVEITSRKIRNGTYQTSVYSGTGMPAQVNANSRWK